MKVLFVTNMYPDERSPASGVFVRQQADCLRKLGHEIDIYRIRGEQSRSKYLTAAYDVFRQTRRGHYDVVHAHYGLSGFPALFRSNTPVVVTLHGSDALRGHIQPLISRAVCSLADAVIVVSKGICSRIAGEIIPCGVDLDFFKPHDQRHARMRLGLPLQDRLVLFPFDPARKLKRYELAHAAVASLGTDGVRIVTVCGKPNEEMPWYYSAADAMILCSESEGSPTSIKEALACNLPIVSTDVGDVREIIGEIDGCEICDDNVGSLGHGLKRVLEKAVRQPFDGCSHISRYDQSRTAAAIVNVYERAIRNRMGRGFGTSVASVGKLKPTKDIRHDSAL